VAPVHVQCGKYTMADKGCKINVLNGAIISEWTGTFGEFKGLLKPAKPSFGCSSSDWKDTLQKWLIVQFFVSCFVFPAQLVLYIVAYISAGAPVGDVISAYLSPIITGVISAFLTAWLGWFMLVKREPNCCCFCIIWIENWKLQHLVFGILTALSGLSQLGNAVNALLGALDVMAGMGMVYVLMFAIAAGLTAIVAICQIYVGRAAIGLGQEIAGVNLTPPSVPGKAGEAA